MKDTMREARKHKWFKYYSFIAGIKIKLFMFLYKQNNILRKLIYLKFFNEVWEKEDII